MKAFMEKNKPYIAMIFIQFVYAGMALVSKAVIDKGMNPYVFVVYRQAFATLALAPFAFFIKRITMSLNLYYFAINYTSATFAAAITNTIPAITFVMAVCLRIESVSIKQWHGMAKVLGFVVGLSGAMVFTFFKGPCMYPSTHKENSDSSVKSNSRGDWIKGSLIMLIANTTWSLWLIMQASIVREYPEKVRLTTLQCFFSCIQSAIWAIAVERNLSSWKLGWDINLFSVAYCGVIVTGLTYWLQVWAVEKKGPVFTAIFSPLALLITAIYSALFFKETLHWGSFLGAILLVSGLYCVLWGKSKEGKSETNEEKSETKKETTMERSAPV